MEDNRRISISIPVYNRYRLLLECFKEVIDDERISSINVFDDGSDYNISLALVSLMQNPKILVQRGTPNRGVHKSKKRAVEMSSTEFTILFDSDNLLNSGYIDKIYSFPVWEPTVWYAPTYAFPHFNYKGFNNVIINRHNIKEWVDREFVGRSPFNTYGNTNNMFINKEQYLRCWTDREHCNGEDSLWMAYCWLEKGNSILGVEGLEYFHRVDDHSGEQKGNYNSDGMAGAKIEYVMNLLRNLK